FRKEHADIGRSNGRHVLSGCSPEVPTIRTRRTCPLLVQISEGGSTSRFRKDRLERSRPRKEEKAQRDAVWRRKTGDTRNTRGEGLAVRERRPDHRVLARRWHCSYRHGDAAEKGIV